MRLRFLVVLLLLGCTAAENEWAAAYESDRAAIFQEIRANHPGAVDALNPDFNFWLDDGLRAKRQVTDRYSYTYALLAYVAGFRDGHLNVSIDVERDVRRWPGFIAAWRDDTLKVYSSTVSEIPVGATIGWCDRLTARGLLEERVFRFQMNPAIPGHWLRAGPRSLIDLGNPFAPAPEHCTFIIEDREETVALSWRDFEWDEVSAPYAEAAARVPTSASLTYPTADIVWFSAPTFGPNESQRDIYNESIELLSTLDDPDQLIVIDLRNNGGGASMWGDRIATAIWGDANSDLAIGYAEWRASEGNIAYWRTVPTYLEEQFGAGHASLVWADAILQGMEATAANGNELWREPEYDDALPTDPDGPQRATAFPGTVAVLTDTQCGSSCLDAMDVFYGRDNLVHIGGTTSADTQYMEVRILDLPSGHARLTLPIKVYRDRERPDGGYYTPDIAYDQWSWSEDAMQQWVINLWNNGQLKEETAR